jgi:hypothetical protein
MGILLEKCVYLEINVWYEMIFYLIHMKFNKIDDNFFLFILLRHPSENFDLRFLYYTMRILLEKCKYLEVNLWYEMIFYLIHYEI